MAEPRIADRGNRGPKRRVCPNCGAKDSIIFSRATDRQADLFGKVEAVYTKLRRPECTRCRHSFPWNQLFEMSY